MENDERGIEERLETAVSLLDKTLCWFEGRVSAMNALSGEIEKISATVEPNRRDDGVAEKLAAVEREVADLRAASGAGMLNALRKTVPATTSELLAKRGIGDAPVDVRTLDAALAGLSLEQRIAVKSQLLRAGAIA